MFLSGEQKGHRNCWLIGITMLALVWLGATASQAPGFCTTKVIHDYKAPLAKLPLLPSPPIDGRLPFAPPRVFFRSLGAGPLQVGEGVRGYGLSSDTSSTLDWKLISTLTPINELGQAVAPALTIEQQVGKLDPEAGRTSGEVRIEFPITGDPALYRLEIAIENSSGERLAAFGEYFRVLRPDINFRLFLNRKQLKPGQTFRVTLANPGVAWLSFGLFRGIEYKQNNSWVAPPVKFPRKIVPAIGLGMGPGESKSCWQVKIPEDAAPGRYRFTTGVGVGTFLPARRGGERILKAGFSVLPRKAFAIASSIPRP